MSEGEYSISTDYLNILNSKVNNLYDFIQKNNDANHSINTFSNETNMISYVKIFFIIIVFLFLGFTIYNYLDRNGYFDDKIENKTFEEQPTPENITNKPTKSVSDDDVQNLKYTVKNLNKKTVRFMDDNTNNNMQNNKKQKKGKFCYLGTDRGFRSCVELQNNQECESQKLFPTMEMCVNPQLRYT